ncbi:MAG: amidohydrolase, partial [Mesorhizobium sp.]
AMPALTLEEAVAAIEGASSHLLSFGVASVMDAGVGLNGRLLDMAAFQAARRSGRLPLRVYLALLAGPDGILDECYAAGLVTGAGDEFLKIGPAKLFADGSIGGHTAAMSLPYFNDRNNRGIFIYSDKEMQDLVADCMARGYQVATHAIGDAAIEQVLLAYERAMAGGHSELRHRIEHCGFGTNEQMRRLRDAGILPIPQPCFISHYGDVYADAVGAERTGASYPMRSWIENHMQPAASSDSPICPPDTLANLASMLTRKGPSGIIYGQDQTIDIERAIETMTYNGAYASHSEKYKGRLLPGQAADIAILDRDISALLPDEVSATKVDATIVAGHIAFDRLGACSG